LNHDSLVDHPVAHGQYRKLCPRLAVLLYIFRLTDPQNGAGVQ